MSLSDSGGIGAKKGFLYQDYVAALFTIKMLNNKEIRAVRCEVSDDIDVIYSSFTEYVQVKTTHAEKSWLLSELTEKTFKLINKRKVYNNDSILHKSLNCDSNTNIPAKFRIVTPRDICKKLSYLKIKIHERRGKDGRDALLKSIKNAIKNYTSPNGNDAEYWLDNTTWDVIPSAEFIKLTAFKLITTSAYELFGIYLNPTRDPERILNDLLVNLIEKSATSIVLRSIDKKTYKREDFIDWFKNEIEHYHSKSNQYVKVYTYSPQKLQAILLTFYSEHNKPYNKGDVTCKGLHGSYHRNSYEYNNISKGIKNWLPEVLLRPSEIADQSPEKLEEKIASYTKRKIQHLSDLNKLIANVLLHAAVRTNYTTQPIPARLYINNSNTTSFDNIHIIIKNNDPDMLLMGFSHIINNDIDSSIKAIVNDFDKLLSSDVFRENNERILEEKEDNYLLSHDIDEILSSSSSLDENISRFIFSFFIGYETNILDCDQKNMAPDYLAHLESEVKINFNKLLDILTLKDGYFKELNITVYLYPIPSIKKLKLNVKNAVEAK
jgi:hypothetical protein